jgi:hypothetical protein
MPYPQGLLPPRRQPDDLGGLLDPNIVERGMLLPFGRTKQGGMEFAVPEVLLSLARSARLPGRVAQDRPWTPEDVTEMALNVAGTGYIGGGLLTGGKVAPNTLQMFAGAEAKTADKAALKAAQKMKKARKSRNQIWEETGWFKDADGHWKFEIDDRRAQFIDEGYRKLRRMREGSEMPLKGAFRHKEVSKAYPQGEPFEGPWSGQGYEGTRLVRGGSGTEGGYASPGGFDYIGLNTGYMGPKLDKPGMRGTALHEIQHLVQGREGFAMGGDVGSVKVPRLPKKIENKLDKLEREFRALRGGSPERIKKVTEYHKLEGPYTRYGAYERLAGEAEARNVTTRMDMTSAQRRKTPPWKTLDVPEGELVYTGLLKKPRK